MFHNCAERAVATRPTRPVTRSAHSTYPFLMAHLQHACLFEKPLPDCHVQNKAGAFGARVALAAIDFLCENTISREITILIKFYQILTKFDQILISFGADLLIYKQIGGGPLGKQIGNAIAGKIANQKSLIF